MHHIARPQQGKWNGASSILLGSILALLLCAHLVLFQQSHWLSLASRKLFSHAHFYLLSVVLMQNAPAPRQPQRIVLVSPFLKLSGISFIAVSLGISAWISLSN